MSRFITTIELKREEKVNEEEIYLFPYGEPFSTGRFDIEYTNDSNEKKFMVLNVKKFEKISKKDITKIFPNYKFDNWEEPTDSEVKIEGDTITIVGTYSMLNDDVCGGVHDIILNYI